MDGGDAGLSGSSLTRKHAGTTSRTIVQTGGKVFFKFFSSNPYYPVNPWSNKTNHQFKGQWSIVNGQSSMVNGK
jgi:hypothetical protein